MSKKQKTTHEEENISAVLGLNVEGLDDEEVDNAIRNAIVTNQRVLNQLQEMFRVKGAEGVLDAVVDFRRHGVWTGTLVGQISMYVKSDDLEDVNALLAKVEESHDKKFPILFIAAGPTLNSDLCFNFLPKSQFELRRKEAGFKSVLITVHKKSEFLYAFFKVMKHYIDDKLRGKVRDYDQLEDVIKKVWDACVQMQHPVMLQFNVDNYSKLKFYSSAQEVIDQIKAFLVKKQKRVYAGDIKIAEVE